MSLSRLNVGSGVSTHTTYLGARLVDGADDEAPALAVLGHHLHHLFFCVFIRVWEGGQVSFVHTWIVRRVDTLIPIRFTPH